MIIPIRCMTCGKVLADLWNHYQNEINKEQTPEDTININSKKIEKTHRGKVMDQLKLKRYCCRRHLLTHADLIDII